MTEFNRICSRYVLSSDITCTAISLNKTGIIYYQGTPQISLVIGLRWFLSRNLQHLLNNNNNNNLICIAPVCAKKTSVGRMWEEGCCWLLLGSCIPAFDWYRNQRPRVTLNGHYVLWFKMHASFGANHDNWNYCYIALSYYENTVLLLLLLLLLLFSPSLSLSLLLLKEFINVDLISTGLIWIVAGGNASRCQFEKLKWTDGRSNEWRGTTGLLQLLGSEHVTEGKEEGMTFGSAISVTLWRARSHLASTRPCVDFAGWLRSTLSYQWPATSPEDDLHRRSTSAGPGSGVLTRWLNPKFHRVTNEMKETPRKTRQIIDWRQ